jgi:hypothetical protein
LAITVTAATPLTGYATGGTTITLTGTGLDTAKAVLVAGRPGVILSQTTTSLVFRTPPGTVGSGLPIGVVDATDTVVSASSAFAYTAAPAVDTIATGLARKYALDISPDGGTTWTRVRGVTDFKPAIAATMQDDSDYDSNGWGSDVKTMLKWSLVTKIKRGLGLITGIYDPGQELIRAAHDQFGSAGVVQARWYERGTSAGDWSPDGGNTSALSTVTVTLTGTGARTPITNPNLS